MVHSRTVLLALFSSRGHWPFTSIHVPGLVDLCSWTEGPGVRVGVGVRALRSQQGTFLVSESLWTYGTLLRDRV